MLIDTFVNAVYLYDDKVVITFNYKDGSKTITFSELNAALAGQHPGSDMNCSGAPRQKDAASFRFRGFRKSRENCTYAASSFLFSTGPADAGLRCEPCL